jgi:hypothetical protein
VNIQAENNFSKDLSSQFPTVKSSMSGEIGSYQEFGCPLKYTCQGDCASCEIYGTVLQNKRWN